MNDLKLSKQKLLVLQDTVKKVVARHERQLDAAATAARLQVEAVAAKDAEQVVQAGAKWKASTKKL